LYELPMSGGVERKRPTAPSPLSPRESDVLRQLAEGNVYEDIAKNLHLSTSTVRTHLHNIYGKLGVKDRAQAVLNAAENGWL
jgi:DNA-binding NarL/FixJ family response regulator